MSVTAPAVDRSDAAWHEWRRGGLGGSDIAAVCGLSKFGSPFSTYLVKRGEIDEDDLSGSPMVEFGKRLEPIIPGWFHERTGLYVTGEQTWCVHPEHDHHRCTVDGFVSETPPPEFGVHTFDALLGVAEIKITGQSAKDWETIPDQYAIQGQWQLHVTGMGHLWFPVIHRHNGQFEVYEMDRDELVITELVRLADAFWQRVQDGDPPSIDGHEATTSALKKAYPDAFDERVALDADLLDMRDVATGRLKAARQEVDAVENQIKGALGSSMWGEVNGDDRVSFKSQDRTTVDSARLKEEHPDVFAEVSKTTSYRVLRVRPPKKEK